MPEQTPHILRAVGQDAADTAAKLGPRSDAPDADLMRRAAAGDRDAYGELFRRHAPSIWQTAYLLLHDSEAAEDVVQLAFMNGLSHIAGFRGDAPPRAWLASIALNECRQIIRRKSYREKAADAATLEEARPAGPPRRGVLTSLLRRETAQRLAVALGFLTDQQREVFVLHYVDGLPYEEIAALLGTTAGAARALSQRARETLQGQLGEDVTAAPLM